MIKSSSIVVLGVIISISINYIFLNYIEKLERISCKCSLDWKTKFIKVYSTYLIVLQTLILILDYNIIVKFIKTILPFYFFSQFFGVIYLLTLFSYSNKLRNLKCDCSEKWERELMYYYSMVLIITIIIIFLVNLLFITSILIKL